MEPFTGSTRFTFEASFNAYLYHFQQFSDSSFLRVSKCTGHILNLKHLLIFKNKNDYFTFQSLCFYENKV